MPMSWLDKTIYLELKRKGNLVVINPFLQLHSSYIDLIHNALLEASHDLLLSSGYGVEPNTPWAEYRKKRHSLNPNRFRGYANLTSGWKWPYDFRVVLWLTRPCNIFFWYNFWHIASSKRLQYPSMYASKRNVNDWYFCLYMKKSWKCCLSPSNQGEDDIIDIIDSIK